MPDTGRHCCNATASDHDFAGENALSGCLVIVQLDTVVKRHRHGFELYWLWKSGKTGRPKVPQEIRPLIRRMSAENPPWGARRIQFELHLLGQDVAESTVAKYMVRPRPGPPSLT